MTAQSFFPEGTGKWFLTREDELRGGITLERYQGTHRTVFGSNVAQKCRMCGGKTQCKLSDGFMDLCTPKPVPKGTLIIDGCAIFIPRLSSRTKNSQAAISRNRNVAQEKRQDKFMINHGFRLKDKLDDLMLRDLDKARAFAARLTFTDWQAINHIGGLNKAPVRA